MTADAQLAFLRRLMGIECAYHEIHRHHAQGRAAASTVEALVLVLRARGTRALQEAPVRRRLGELSEAQMREVVTRLQKPRPEIAKPWTADQVDRLLESWDALHE